MAKLVSKTYGDALFEVALENHKETLLYEEVLELNIIIKENQELSKFMNHPKVSEDEKLKVIQNIFKGKVSDELMGFLITIIEKNRYKQINEILQYFIDKMKLHNGIGTAYVTTAIPLTEEEQEDIKKRLLQTTTFKSIEMHYKTDAAIIGGVIIQIGDKVVDNSVQTKLEKLERELLAVQL